VTHKYDFQKTQIRLAGDPPSGSKVELDTPRPPARLSRAVDSAAKQPGQVAMVSEGAHNAACLLRFAATDLATDTKLADFTLVTDT
jgi:hypothetical protein